MTRKFIGKSEEKSKEEEKAIESSDFEREVVSLNEGQKIQLLGRKKAGMTHEEALKFVIEKAKNKKEGRSQKCLEYREKNKLLFGKSDKVKKEPSIKKLAYLKKINGG